MVIRSLLSSQGPCWDLSQLQAPIYLPPSTTVLIPTQLFIVFLPYTIITPLNVPPPQVVVQGRDCQLLRPKATSSHLIVPSHPLYSHYVINDIPSVSLIISITQSLANSSRSNPHPNPQDSIIGSLQLPSGPTGIFHLHTCSSFWLLRQNCYLFWATPGGKNISLCNQSHNPPSISTFLT